MKREHLADNLAQVASRPTIQRGKGVTLSTAGEDEDKDEGHAGENAKTPSDVNANKQKSERAQTPKSANAEVPERTSRGFAIRSDLVKAMKRIALEEDKKLYTVLEEAIVEYLDRRGSRS